jgi:hypothetical protein
MTDAEFWIENYAIARRDRSQNGSGVCIYIRKGKSFTLA